MNLKSNKAITLVALIITIIVLLILAGVSLSMVLGENGLINKAQSSVNKYKESSENEQKLLNQIEDYLDAKGLGPSISNTESYVGKYADVDGDGIVDGVIYADLAVGGSGTWYNNNGVYTIPKVTMELKEYCVSQKSYTNAINGEQEVIRAKISNGTPRFYVMALTDVDGKQNGTQYDWYSAARGKMVDYASTTSVDFGKGASNTKTMIAKWNAKAYGPQNACSSHKDIWGQIQEQANNGWYVPSRAEWSAFANNLSINTSNYASKKLSAWYWSSSQWDPGWAWCADFTGGHVNGYTVNNYDSVRLGTTF